MEDLFDMIGEFDTTRRRSHGARKKARDNSAGRALTGLLGGDSLGFQLRDIETDAGWLDLDHASASRLTSDELCDDELGFNEGEASELDF